MTVRRVAAYRVRNVRAESLCSAAVIASTFENGGDGWCDVATSTARATRAATTPKIAGRRRMREACQRLRRQRFGYATFMRVHLESDTLSNVGRAGHHVALGALLGGNLFARFAMHPA